MEKWMHSKSNPYLSGARIKPVNKVSSYKMNGYKKPSHYGKPVQLFKDSDRDGVANVFDCKPYNKRRQDAIAPMMGGSPVGEMIQRQEATRQARAYEAYLKKIQEEQERLSNVQYIDRTVTNYYPGSTSTYIESSSGKLLRLGSPEATKELAARESAAKQSSSSESSSVKIPITYPAGGTLVQPTPKKGTVFGIIASKATGIFSSIVGGKGKK